MKKWYSLIDKVYRIDNLTKAFKAVKSNKGAPGIDGETIETFEANMVRLNHELKTETYNPLPVRRVYIDKDDGSKRPLGIPTVRDRVVQQALKNALEPIFEPSFHPSSYGYRPNRSCQKAVAKAERFMNKYGLEHVVDMDLSKCFDTLNHEIIIKSVNEKVSDSKILKLIGKFLKAGAIESGIVDESDIGCPQGAAISPLLMNIYLDYFDKAMMIKGIRIVRYADDILIFAKTKALAVHILEKDLKLKVMAEDIIREAGYMLPQSNNTKEFLQLLLDNNQSEEFPKEIVEKLLESFNKDKEDKEMNENKTLDNLMKAFAGEAEANRKYLAYSKKAEKDGNMNAAKLFKAASDAETLHALKHFEVAGKVSSTVENLKDAVAGETYEYKDMYPDFVKEAEAEGNKAALMSFTFAMKAEEVHARLYKEALEALEELDKTEEIFYYLCPVCGNIEKVRPGKCSICGVPGDK